MVKELTAVFLMLAIVNPFCCCFGEVGQDSSLEASTSKPVQSCCSQPVDTSDGDDAPSSKSCPCRKPAVQSDSDDSKLVKLKVIQQLDEGILVSNVDVNITSWPACSLGFQLRPPPLSLRLHLVHCVFRT